MNGREKSLFKSEILAKMRSQKVNFQKLIDWIFRAKRPNGRPKENPETIFLLRKLLPLKCLSFKIPKVAIEVRGVEKAHDFQPVLGAKDLSF